MCKEGLFPLFFQKKVLTLHGFCDFKSVAPTLLKVLKC